MDFRTRFGLGLALVLALVALHIFSPGERMFVERFECMGTMASVTLYGRSEDAASYAALILRGDLLVIDDLGTELTNNYVESELFRVLNERIRSGLTTVISTNLTPGELASRYSERIFSRMMSGFRLVKLTGEDLRLKKLVQ